MGRFASADTPFEAGALLRQWFRSALSALRAAVTKVGAGLMRLLETDH
jgi:hypothetical protein